jgi:hypothetical protein
MSSRAYRRGSQLDLGLISMKTVQKDLSWAGPKDDDHSGCEQRVSYAKRKSPPIVSG